MVQLTLMSGTRRVPTPEELGLKRGSQNCSVYLYLVNRAGAWVPAPELALRAGYPRPVWKLTGRISEIRARMRRLGGDVENRLDREKDPEESFYRIVLPLAGEEAAG